MAYSEVRGGVFGILGITFSEVPKHVEYSEHDVLRGGTDCTLGGTGTGGVLLLAVPAAHSKLFYSAPDTRGYVYYHKLARELSR